MDFGIAKKIRDRSSLNGNTIVTNMFLGTYRYAAPEQLALSREIDGRGDIYSLGIIFYRMLSGTDPFGLRSELRPISDVAWMKAHTSQPPQPLRSHPACEQISPQLEAVVLKCLQKSKRDRFATIADLKQAIDAAIAASPVDIASTTSNTIVQTRPPTAGSDPPTVPRQAPLPQVGSDPPTVPRQAPLPQVGSDPPTVPRQAPLPQVGSDPPTVPRQAPLPQVGSDPPTVPRQAPLPLVGSDPFTVPRQITPPAEPEIDEPITIARIPAAPESIEQPNCDDGEISDRTIYQEAASPASTQLDQTLYQGVPLPKPNQPQLSSDRAPTSPASTQLDQTLYQGVPLPKPNQPQLSSDRAPTSPASTPPDRTLYQGVPSPKPNQPQLSSDRAPTSPASTPLDRTLYQGVPLPKPNQFDQTLYQGVPSPSQDDADRRIYQRLSLLTRLRRMSRQIKRVTFQSIVSLIRKIVRSLRQIQSWIRSRRFRL